MSKQKRRVAVIVLAILAALLLSCGSVDNEGFVDWMQGDTGGISSLHTKVINELNHNDYYDLMLAADEGQEYTEASLTKCGSYAVSGDYSDIKGQYQDHLSDQRDYFSHMSDYAQSMIYGDSDDGLEALQNARNSLTAANAHMEDVVDSMRELKP